MEEKKAHHISHTHLPSMLPLQSILLPVCMECLHVMAMSCHPCLLILPLPVLPCPPLHPQCALFKFSQVPVALPFSPVALQPSVHFHMKRSASPQAQ